MSYLSLLCGYIGWMIGSYIIRYRNIKEVYEKWVTDYSKKEIYLYALQMAFKEESKVTGFFGAMTIASLIIYLI